jgi:hypothetical protein
MSEEVKSWSSGMACFQEKTEGMEMNPNSVANLPTG